MHNLLPDTLKFHLNSPEPVILAILVINKILTGSGDKIEQNLNTKQKAVHKPPVTYHAQ